MEKCKMKEKIKEKEIDWEKTRVHIRTLMKSKEYTIVGFSKEMGTSDSTIKNYLYGRSNPPIDMLYRMVGVFGLNTIEDVLVFE